MLAGKKGEVSMSICNGIDVIIDEQFKEVINNVGKTPHYKHKKSCQLLHKQPSHFDAYHLIANMLLCVERNWKVSQRRPSKENWRFKKVEYINQEKNKSPEKLLEKKIACITSEEWANQVPTASGLINENYDKLRNVDLVYKLHEHEYELIELKVGSDSPLAAAMEVLQYAVLYIFSRLHYNKEEQSSKKLLQAETIHLIVLAPHSYYNKCNLEWLEEALNKGLRAFTETQPFKLVMDFQFKAFPQDFNPLPSYNAEAHLSVLKAALKEIKPIYGLKQDI